VSNKGESRGSASLLPSAHDRLDSRCMVGQAWCCKGFY